MSRKKPSRPTSEWSSPISTRHPSIRTFTPKGIYSTRTLTRLGKWNTMFVTYLESALDGTVLDASKIWTTHKGRPLLVRYDLATIGRTVRSDDFAHRENSLWRYRELLPLPRGSEPVTFGEGMSPLLTCPRLATQFGLTRL